MGTDEKKRDRDWARSLVARALRANGAGAVCRDEPRDFTNLAMRSSYSLTVMIWLGTAFSIADWINASVLQTSGIASALVIAALLIAKVSNALAALLALCAGWLACLIVQVALSDHDVFATLMVPGLLALAGVSILRVRRLSMVARAAPLALPVTLSVLVIPLFTSDLWSAAAGLNPGNLIALVVVTLVPLVAVVERRLRERVDAVVRDTASASPTPVSGAVDLLAQYIADDEQRDGDVQALERLIRRPVNPSSQAVTEVARALERRLVRLVAWAVFGLAALAFVYLGLIAWILVPVATARDWVTDGVGLHTVSIFGASFTVPTDPYLTVAALLGLLATVVLLASVAVDDEYAEGLVTALIQDHAREALPAAELFERFSPGEPRR